MDLWARRFAPKHQLYYILCFTSLLVLMYSFCRSIPIIKKRTFLLDFSPVRDIQLLGKKQEYYLIKPIIVLIAKAILNSCLLQQLHRTKSLVRVACV